MPKHDLDGPGAISVPDAARMLGIGKSLCWSLVWDGSLRSLRLGKRVVIPLKVIEQLLNGTTEDDRGSVFELPS